jgi:translation initiation factor eIF-2B subunit gamma
MSSSGFKKDGFKQDMQAVILASGNDGDNLYPLTELLPTALLPVANRPLLWYQLELLERAGGFHQVIVLTFERWMPRLSTYISEHYQGKLQV